MVLRIEAFNPHSNEWVKMGDLKPGEIPGSISQNKPDGKREIYIFECEPDDSKSVIYRSESGVDIATPQIRAALTEGLEQVAILTEGQDYKLSVKTDTSSQRRLMKFTHIKE